MLKLIAFTTLAACLAAPLCFGQVAIARATIPFNFLVGETLMPAGDYVIRDYSGSVALISEQGRSVVALSYAESRNTSGQAKLEFMRYGDAFFLRKVWAGNSENGAALLVSKRERQIARAIAAKETTTIALRR